MLSTLKEYKMTQERNVKIKYCQGLEKNTTGVVLTWQRNRMGRPLSPPQIHQKNI